MGLLEGNGMPVLYIGCKVPKDYADTRQVSVVLML